MKANNLFKKTGLFLGVLVLFTLLFAGKKQHSNSEPVFGTEEKINFKKDTNVLVTVNTDSIDNYNIEEMVILSDDRGENSGKPKDYVSVVEKNQKIYWRGIAKNADSRDVVEIIKIFRKTDGGSQILDKTFKDPNKKGVVVGKIKNKKIQGLEYYNIRIMINQDTTRVYDIDPKLKMLAVD